MVQCGDGFFCCCYYWKLYRKLIISLISYQRLINQRDIQCSEPRWNRSNLCAWHNFRFTDFFVSTRAGPFINFKLKLFFSVKTIGEKENRKIDCPLEHCSALRRSATVQVCFLEFICYFSSDKMFERIYCTNTFSFVGLAKKSKL